MANIVIRKSGVAITLCGQEDDARIPSYGKNAIVEGFISLAITNVLKVEAKVRATSKCRI